MALEPDSCSGARIDTESTSIQSDNAREANLPRILLKLLYLSVLLAPTAFAQVTGAKTPIDSCAIVLSTPEQAIAKADWVIEGTVNMVLNKRPPELVLDQSRPVYQKGTDKVHSTTVMMPTSCFFGGAAPFEGKAGIQFYGKRMRFYGTLYTTSPTHRFFFMEPADRPLVDTAEKKRADRTLAKLRTEASRTNAANPLGDGWHRAHSKHGNFSIDLPAPFEEATWVKQGVPAFMLRAKDTVGSTFIAVFEPSGQMSELGGTFDNEMETNPSKVSRFRGFPAVVTARSTMAQTNGELINHSIMFRVPGGTYMIGIVTTKLNEARSMQDKERFYNSLAFD